MLYVKKYRPRTFEELIGQDEVKQKLKDLTLENCPHILMYGISGIGKTCVSEILGRKFFGKNMGNLKELNASDERGIPIVRGEIKMFCKSQPFGVSRKIIFLDECDFMTSEAQHALRRMMEKYSTTNIFILSCNYIEKMIPAIKSRCSLIHFVPIKKQLIGEYLKMICEKEGLKYEAGVLGKIADICKGDLRMAINELQKYSTLELIKVSDVKKPYDVTKLLEEIINKHFIQSKMEMERLINDGLTERQLLVEIGRKMFDYGDLKNRGELMRLLADVDYKLVVGSTPELQMIRFLLEAMKLIGNGVDNTR